MFETPRFHSKISPHTLGLRLAQQQREHRQRVDNITSRRKEATDALPSWTGRAWLMPAHRLNPGRILAPAAPPEDVGLGQFMLNPPGIETTSGTSPMVSRSQKEEMLKYFQVRNTDEPHALGLK